ncbi:hypothetical protein BUALT_BualtUnG0002500 [Buddleja alternifolia]|uniref:Uncharacterized protein n=1 Tax=Buddleja alternifolia TaxID=168488 RepID=A0AAV6W713_9LAMI|nr:hypothetical protein BUALT_BualtUnG0002500 [Buddleja alternifolia]
MSSLNDLVESIYRCLPGVWISEWHAVAHYEESNVRKENIRKADPPCVSVEEAVELIATLQWKRIFSDSGRTNLIELTMLPKGEWPKWCRSCGGSGLGYCSRCLGTGEYRYIMGFQFMHKDTEQLQDNQLYRVLDRRSSRSFTDVLLNDDCSDSTAV